MVEDRSREKVRKFFVVLKNDLEKATRIGARYFQVIEVFEKSNLEQFNPKDLEALVMLEVDPHYTLGGVVLTEEKGETHG